MPIISLLVNSQKWDDKTKHSDRLTIPLPKCRLLLDPRLLPPHWLLANSFMYAVRTYVSNGFLLGERIEQLRRTNSTNTVEVVRCGHDISFYHMSRATSGEIARSDWLICRAIFSCNARVLNYGKWPAKQANAAVLKAPHRTKEDNNWAQRTNSKAMNRNFTIQKQKVGM